MGMHYLILMSSQVFKGNVTYLNAFSEMRGWTDGTTNGQASLSRQEQKVWCQNMELQLATSIVPEG